MIGLDPVAILEQRLGFLEGITEVAKFCNWTDAQVQELRDYLLAQIIDIDNLMYETYNETEDRDLAFAIWEGHMEDLRHWLSMVLGVRIKYV